MSLVDVVISDQGVSELVEDLNGWLVWLVWDEGVRKATFLTWLRMEDATRASKEIKARENLKCWKFARFFWIFENGSITRCYRRVPALVEGDFKIIDEMPAFARLHGQRSTCLGRPHQHYNFLGQFSLKCNHFFLYRSHSVAIGQTSPVQWWPREDNYINYRSFSQWANRMSQKWP